MTTDKDGQTTFNAGQNPKASGVSQDKPVHLLEGENVQLRKGENRLFKPAAPLIESTSSRKPPQPVYYEGRPVSPPPPPPPNKEK